MMKGAPFQKIQIISFTQIPNWHVKILDSIAVFTQFFKPSCHFISMASKGHAKA
jgi:hypothetical protein